ncbi:alkaline phosphatase family protein [Kitasatospora aureofaciens]|uniref:alkaline phosphatase family protein n=1 Tax=Kitasatospora aureofaciens TaxID=1894 RepID=UPI001C440026|nr:alkaline phosphatase family protein [Kitasatospora aureofaciens]MBV6702237.1 alkaline phosphatase family protein [Kitasatospora aureofaciens]
MTIRGIRLGRRGTTGKGARPGTVATLTATALAATALVGGSSVSPAAAESHTFRPPKIKHVWVIMLENKSYEAAFTGLNQNSYLWKTLPQYGELLRQYYGTGHYSLDNYISAVSGQAPAPDTQADCAQYKDVSPGTPAPDGQVHATHGCVYPNSVYTLFNQLDDKNLSWKAYMQDLGNTPGREDVNRCGIPGDPSGDGVPAPGGATAQDQYVVKHNPTAWFHSLIDDPQECAQVAPLDGRAATADHAAVSGLAEDLKSADTTPAFSWITPNNCSDAHDTTCKGDNLSGDPNNHQGGLYASDRFLEKVIPQIMASPAFQDGGMIDITFDEAFPPYKMYGNSSSDYTGNQDPKLNTPTDTAQSVVACCNELPGPNTSQPGAQAFGQDTTPGGGITGSLLISRYIKPGTISDQPYNHYSFLRSMEDLFRIDQGGTDGHGHLGYAAMPGLRPFGPDVYNNPGGKAMQPAALGSNGVYSATGQQPQDQPAEVEPDFTGPAAANDSLLQGAGK